MPSSSDPEKYSIDEMMERLKRRSTEDPIEDGELVTRADGTVAIKVRKRKRRSHQPHKEEQKRIRRARMIQASGVLLLVLMAGFAVGSAIVYANSAPFRTNVIRMIAASSGAEVELEQFRVSPTRANAGRAIMTWPDSSPLRELSLRSISASIAPATFLGKSLTGEEITAAEGQLRLGTPQTTAAAAQSHGQSASTPIRFKRYAIPRLTIAMGANERPAVLLRDTEASFQPDNPNGRPQLLLNRGQLLAPGWPNIQMERAHIEFRESEIDIVGMRFVHDNDSRGQLDLSGTVSPHFPGRQCSLDVAMEVFPLAGILGPDLGALISGRVETVTAPESNHFKFTPGPEPAASLEVNFRKSLAAPIELANFKFLSGLALLLEDNWFERPAFELEATGTIKRADGAVVMDDIDFAQRGRMALRGRISADAQQRLSGSIRLGISEPMLIAAENPRLLAIFGPTEDDFRWVELTISGTCKAPADDFLALYEAAPKAPAGQAGQADDAPPTFDELLAPE